MCACTYLCVGISLAGCRSFCAAGCSDGCTMPSESTTPIGREVLTDSRTVTVTCGCL